MAGTAVALSRGLGQGLRFRVPSHCFVSWSALTSPLALQKPVMSIQALRLGILMYLPRRGEDHNSSAVNQCKLFTCTFKGMHCILPNTQTALHSPTRRTLFYGDKAALHSAFKGLGNYSDPCTKRTVLNFEGPLKGV